MRREAPNPFGTSLIDLLVGALAMVALLWTMNAGNSGHKGTGPDEQTSAMALIEQFGETHIVKLRISQPRRWSCEFGLNFSNKKAVPLHPHSPACTGENGHVPPSVSDGKLEFAVTPSDPSGKPTKVLWRLDEPPGGKFLVSLVLTVENLAVHDLVAEVGIVPCCSATEPHYLRVLALSGAGKEELVTFWHEAKELRKLLKDLPQTANWINEFRQRVRDDQVRPRRVLFDANGAKCLLEFKLRRVSNAPELKIVFEAEGDVRLVLPPPPSVGTEHVILAAQFGALLQEYVGTPP